MQKKEFIKLKFNGQEITINRVWGGHRFTDSELKNQLQVILSILKLKRPQERNLSVLEIFKSKNTMDILSGALSHYHLNEKKKLQELLKVERLVLPEYGEDIDLLMKKFRNFQPMKKLVFLKRVSVELSTPLKVN